MHAQLDHWLVSEWVGAAVCQPTALAREGSNHTCCALSMPSGVESEHM